MSLPAIYKKYIIFIIVYLALFGFAIVRFIISPTAQKSQINQENLATKALTQQQYAEVRDEMVGLLEYGHDPAYVLAIIRERYISL